MMTVPSFPGMNPYLESPYRWPEIHTWLMVEIARSLNPQLLPKYRAVVETRVCIDSMPVGFQMLQFIVQAIAQTPQPQPL